MSNNQYVESLAQSHAFIDRYYGVTDAGQQTLSDYVSKCAEIDKVYGFIRLNNEGQECE